MPSGLPTVGCIRDYFVYDPPTTASNKTDCNGTCCKCSNPAEVFFFLNHRWAANTSGPLPITLPPLFAPSFIFLASAVCCLCTFPKFIQKGGKGEVKLAGWDGVWRSGARQQEGKRVGIRMTSWTHFLPFAAIKQSRPVISAAQGAEKKTPLNPNGETWLSIIAWQYPSLLLKPAYPPAWQTMGTPVRWKLFLLFFSCSLFFSPSDHGSPPGAHSAAKATHPLRHPSPTPPSW